MSSTIDRKGEARAAARVALVDPVQQYRSDCGAALAVARHSVIRT